jgi:hypothetical protein
VIKVGHIYTLIGQVIPIGNCGSKKAKKKNPEPKNKNQKTKIKK